MLDFAECERLVSTARDQRSKPVQNNTRVEKRDADTYALRLHTTDIATFHRDGRITANSGGWRTVTTLQRLRAYVFTQGQLSSEGGVWYVKAERDQNDPEPARGDRTVPKPFHALDPGPEPVKPTEGCLVGTEAINEYDEDHLVSEYDLEGSGTGWTLDDIIRPYERESSYFVGYVRRHQRDVTVFGEAGYNYHGAVELPMLGTSGTATYEQCPHCKLFEEQHRAWNEAMNGGGWGRDKTHGYAKMVELLDEYGSREAWQEAYIEDYRAAREQRKIHREWVDRNRVLFEDGDEITANGYAPRPDLKAIARTLKREKRISKKKQRINKFVDDAVDALERGIPMPSGGDCWYCLMRQAPQENEPHPGAISMGDAMPTLHSDGSVCNEPSHDHLEQHIKERYYVPSMFVNALRDSGYRDAGIYMFLEMDPENDRMGGDKISRETVVRALRKYLHHRLIPELSAGKTAVTV